MQGTDYAYTINGWLKGINMPSLSPDHDPGGDGAATGPNTGFARDAFGMILGYHEKDFVKSGSVYDSSHSTTSSWHVPNPTFLYNGNISSWSSNSRRASGATDTALASVYHYDLLNRIRNDSTRLRGATAWSAVGSHWQSEYTYDGNGNIKTLYRNNASGSQMDALTYEYISGTNKLVNINDYQGASTGADIGDQNGNNYAYDATGNMTQDTAAGIEAGGIVWSPYNKIKSITWYVRDAQGNTLATYTKPSDSTTARQKEVMLYGSTRLAVTETHAPYSDSETDTLGIFDRVSSRTLGEKRYELTDHLGNVRATVSDVVIDHSGNRDAEISTRTDYYPFGMIMGGRNSSLDDAHRYGFNGKENDNEVKGEGVQQDYGFRIYDARVARFLSVDPLGKDYPWYTPYQFAGNKPLWAIDLDGLEEWYYTNGTKSGYVGPLSDKFASEKKVVSNRDVQSKVASSGAAEGIGVNGARGVLAANVRDWYMNRVSALESSDKAGRIALKQTARSATPTEYREAAKLIEASRSVQSTNNAAKTNIYVNQAMRSVKRVSVLTTALAATESIVEIGSSDTPAETAIEEGGGWVGAAAGASIGAAAGTKAGVAFGVGTGPGVTISGFLGAVVGGVIGGIMGEEATSRLIDNLGGSCEYNPRRHDGTAVRDATNVERGAIQGIDR